MTEKLKKGFALMSPELQRSIASLGGKKAHEMRTAHRWTSEEASAAAKKARGHRFTSEEARVAGRKGGEVTRERNKRSVPRDTEEEIKAEAAPD